MPRDKPKPIRKFVTPYGDIYHGDCLKVMASLPEQSVDLVVSSPPYEDARAYDELEFSLKGQDWVDWMVEVFRASLRVCKGVVCMVVGHGKGARNWSAAPALLLADLKRSGIILRRPLWYKRNGIMGSGGNDWFRADMEFIVCAANSADKLPWSDNTAMGHSPKCPPGGSPSHRTRSGKVNSDSYISPKDRKRIKDLMEKEGISIKQAAKRLGIGSRRRVAPNGSSNLKTGATGARIHGGIYVSPERTNPGDVIDCGAVGGGHLGSNIAHENDAPYPLRVPEFLIRSLCPPGGVVLDPFGGSGTTADAAVRWGRKFITCDLRLSQIELIKRCVVQAHGKKGLLTEL